MNKANRLFINLIMNNKKNISDDKVKIFKELIIKYLLKQIKGENLNGTWFVYWLYIC